MECGSGGHRHSSPSTLQGRLFSVRASGVRANNRCVSPANLALAGNGAAFPELRPSACRVLCCRGGGSGPACAAESHRHRHRTQAQRSTRPPWPHTRRRRRRRTFLALLRRHHHPRPYNRFWEPTWPGFVGRRCAGATPTDSRSVCRHACGPRAGEPNKLTINQS